MRVLIFNADYLRFQDWFYKREPELRFASYATQLAARNASQFGLADFYSKNFIALGHPAAEIHVNNPWLQSAWARERGISITPPAVDGVKRHSPPAWLQRAGAPFKPMLRPLARKIGLSPRLDAQSTEILLAQIEDFGPDLILNQDVFHVDAGLMRRIKGIGKPILVGQVGIEPPRGENWTVYDLMLSQLPRIVRSFRGAGVRAELSHLAFEPGILDALPPTPAMDVEVSFVGQVSVDHRQRIALLEAVARRFDLKFWGARPDTLPASSPLHRCFQGEVWGSEMYQVLRRSRIALNSHIDLAGREAGNMRLFEATGAGAFLLTDFKDNLHTLFEPDQEIGVWRSTADCLDKIDRYLHDDCERQHVATAGQSKTLLRHTYRHRVAELLDFIGAIKS
jgi:spore maturation protein CgeB